MHAFLEALTKTRIVKSAPKVSMVVGTILNLINYDGGDAG